MSENGETQSPEHETRTKREADQSRSRSPSPAKSARSDRKSKSESRSRSRSRSHSRRRRRRRSYSRSRSRSHSRHSRSPKRARHSRSRSRGYDSRRNRRERTRSRSPMSSRRRHFGNRDDPEPSKCLGIFGLSLYTQERDLREVFGRYGSLDEVNVVYDRQSGRSRGFAFIYFRSIDDAIEAKDRCSGIEIDGRRIRVDYSITKRAHTPTPGIYLGKPTARESRDYDRGYSRKRSPSPYYSRRSRYSYSRSRSRSYSPRKKKENSRNEM